MILLVENDTTYTNDLRAMLQAFYSGERITGVSPNQVADYNRELFSEFRFVFTALFMEKHTRLRLEEGGKVGVSLLVPSLSHKSFYLYRGNNPAQYFLFILHLSLS